VFSTCHAEDPGSIPGRDLRTHAQKQLGAACGALASITAYSTRKRCHACRARACTSAQGVRIRVVFACMPVLGMACARAVPPQLSLAMMPSRPSMHASCGVRTQAQLPAVDLKSTPLTSRANWHAEKNAAKPIVDARIQVESQLQYRPCHIVIVHVAWAFFAPGTKQNHYEHVIMCTTIGSCNGCSMVYSCRCVFALGGSTARRRGSRRRVSRYLIRCFVCFVVWNIMVVSRS
jgi:hypothetical protein